MPRLVERLRKRTPGQLRYGQARRIVQTRRREIAEALKEGFAVKDIWRCLVEEEALTIQYRAFCNQVRKLVQGNTDMGAAAPKKVPDKAEEDASTTAVTSTQPAGRTPLQLPDEPRPTFKWNPRPKKEDLI